MQKRYLECGKIVSTHGVRGEVCVQPWCDSPEFLCLFSTIYLQNGENPLTVERARVNKNMVLLKLKGFDTLDEAVTLRGRIIYIDREHAPDDGAHFIQDLIGLSVLDADTGELWGTLTDVLHTGANDIYEITAENGRKLLAPAIPDVIIEINIAEGSILIRPLKGLFEDED